MDGERYELEAVDLARGEGEMTLAQFLDYFQEIGLDVTEIRHGVTVLYQAEMPQDQREQLMDQPMTEVLLQAIQADAIQPEVMELVFQLRGNDDNGDGLDVVIPDVVYNLVRLRQQEQEQ